MWMLQNGRLLNTRYREQTYTLCTPMLPKDLKMEKSSYFLRDKEFSKRKLKNVEKFKKVIGAKGCRRSLHDY